MRNIYGNEKLHAGNFFEIVLFSIQLWESTYLSCLGKFKGVLGINRIPGKSVFFKIVSAINDHHNNEPDNTTINTIFFLSSSSAFEPTKMEREESITLQKSDTISSLFIGLNTNEEGKAYSPLCR